jgi:hypothetical protein
MGSPVLTPSNIAAPIALVPEHKPTYSEVLQSLFAAKDTITEGQLAAIAETLAGKPSK